MQLRKLFLLAAFLPSLLFAQGRFTLDFGSPGDHEIWISDRLTVPGATLKTKDANVNLPAQGGKTDKLFVWDRKSGNLAVKPVGELKGVWKVADADYKLVGKVTIRVEHEGNPVAVAFVSLKNGAESQEKQIDPDSKGAAEFFGVRQGNLEVTVKYNSEGKDVPPAKQGFVLDAKRSQPDPIFVVSLTDPVETLGGTATSKPNEKPASGQATGGKDTGGSILGNLLVYLLGLAGAAALIYFGLRYLKANQDKVKEQLQKVGVEIPDPIDPNQPNAQAAVPIPAAAPPEKILLDDADPLAPISVTSSATPGIPQLRMSNGDVFTIPEGTTTIGRDAACGLALVTESTVSRNHAVVERQGDVVTVADTGSSNGTFVNGARIQSSTTLRAGDQVQFGQVAFRFEV